MPRCMVGTENGASLLRAGYRVVGYDRHTLIEHLDWRTSATTSRGSTSR